MPYIILKRWLFRTTLRIVNKTQILKINQLPKKSSVQGAGLQSVLIFDQYLLKKSSLNKWIKQFEFRIPVKAGESLKTINQYAKVLSQIQKWQTTGVLHSPIQIVGLGGGSLGDFTGFVASTYKRGCPLVHIPSTWLAAIDSAHGGKTGLNLNQTKNQIGTFYPAAKVILSKKILQQQSVERLTEAYGEVLKIALTNRPQLFLKANFAEKFLWDNILSLVNGKIQIVEKDPFEKKGIRHLLNLGHTMGHVYETELNMPHGRAVMMGMLFSLRWSYHRGYIKRSDFIAIVQKLMSTDQAEKDFLKVNAMKTSKVYRHLSQDKKRVSAKHVRFIFIHKIGSIFTASVTAEQIIDECERQRFNA